MGALVVTVVGMIPRVDGAGSTVMRVIPGMDCAHPGPECLKTRLC